MGPGDLGNATATFVLRCIVWSVFAGAVTGAVWWEACG